MSGWGPPPSAPVPGPEPIVGWVVPEDPSGLSTGDIIRGGWRLTTANLGSLVAVTIVPVVLVQLLLLPFWLAFGRIYERMFSFYATLDWRLYANDPEGLQRDLRAAMGTSDDLSILVLVSGGLSFTIGIIGAAALAAATLDAIAGRRPSIRTAYGAVARHAGPIVVPALALGLGYLVVLAPISMNSGSIASADYGTGRAAFSGLLSLVLLVVEFGALYLAIRWAPYFQVVIAEGLGIREALRRSAEITRGVRLRLALAVIAVSMGLGILFAILGLIVAVIVGVAARSFIAGIVAWLVTIAVSGLIFFPILAGSITHVYVRRAETLRGTEGDGSGGGLGQDTAADATASGPWGASG